MEFRRVERTEENGEGEVGFRGLEWVKYRGLRKLVRRAAGEVKNVGGIIARLRAAVAAGLAAMMGLFVREAVRWRGDHVQ